MSICWYLIFLVSSFALYAHTIFLGFFSDDYEMLSLLKYDTLSSVSIYFKTNLIGTTVGHSYGPIYKTILLFEEYFFSSHIWLYHAAQVFLHATIAYGISLLAYQLTKKYEIAVISGLLFVISQSHVSSVVWISVLPHLLATFGYVFSLWAYILFLDSKKVGVYMLAVGFFLFALFAKETAITTPLLWVVLAIIQNKEGICKKIRSIALSQLLPAFGIFIYLLLRTRTTGSLLGYYGSSASVSVQAKLSMLVEMTIAICVPQSLRIEVMRYPGIVGCSLLCVSMLIFLYTSKQYRKKLWFAFVGYVVSSLPFLGLGFTMLTEEGDRYTYLPSVFFVIATSITVFAVFVKKNSQFRRIATYLSIGLFCCIQIIFAYSKLGDWIMADRIIKDANKSYHAVAAVDSGTYTFLLGIPDTYNGAQLFRNAQSEMIDILTEHSLVESERIMLFSLHPFGIVLTEPYKIKERIDCSSMTHCYQIGDGQSHRRMFYGLPVVHTQYATFTLGEFDRVSQTGSYINIDISDKQEQALIHEGYTSISILTISNGKFQRYTLPKYIDMQI